MTARGHFLRSNLQVFFPLALPVSPPISSARIEARYPPRPQSLPGPALAEPPHSRVNLHVSLTQDGMSKLIEAEVPSSGEVPFTFIGPRRLI